MTDSNPAQVGQWGPLIKFPNVPIHVHVLPDGRVLMWGRREFQNGAFDPHADLNVHSCTPFVWDPSTHSPEDTVATTVSTEKPKSTKQAKDGRVVTVNLFCGGHAFLPDGRLLAIGGHFADGAGIPQAAVYTTGPGNGAGTWRATAEMVEGRWYPTATALPDGSVLALSGSYLPEHEDDTRNNVTPQIWSHGAWRNLDDFPHGRPMELYPRAHVLSDGKVFISGPQQQSWLLDTKAKKGKDKQWIRTSAKHALGQLDYAPAVMYEQDKIVYIGGGGGGEKDSPVVPTNQAETIDLSKEHLSKEHLQWTPTKGPMHFGRRQHNGTLLPDGTVLVTGGTGGQGFNILTGTRPAAPVHQAELWDPATGLFTLLAEEEADRCYHATAVLLPDATVLSAGSGEFVGQNDGDSHLNGQIFSPPYLFRGPRPEITSAPAKPLGYRQTFEVTSPQAQAITKVTWIRLSSCTHAFNQSQRINVLDFRTVNGRLQVTTPDSPNRCPPGFYMLFILTSDGVPSVAKILQIQQPLVSRTAMRAAGTMRRLSRRLPAPLTPRSQTAAPAAVSVAGKGTRVVVGLSSTCPYGLGACWGGAHEALTRLDGVDVVNPVANASESTAEVWLKDNRLPPLNQWTSQFRAIVNGRYGWRGVEITLTGTIETHEGSLFLAAEGPRPEIKLGPLHEIDRIQWDYEKREPQPVQAGEQDAYRRLEDSLATSPTSPDVTVTGPLTQAESAYELEVRRFTAKPA
jgi:galactose oxidase